MTDTARSKQIYPTRRSPAHWRVTFNHPPLNIFGPETIPQLNEVINALETDEHVEVVVFDRTSSPSKAKAKAKAIWSNRLAAFDVYIWDQCYSMEQNLRIE